MNNKQTWARIIIGGSIKEPLVQDLLKLLADNNLLCDRYGEPDDDIRGINIMDLVTPEENTLCFESNNVVSGEFKDLETWLRDHGLSYIRSSDQCTEKGEYVPARTNIYTPDRDDPSFIIDDTEHNHMVHVGEISWILDSIKKIKSLKDATKHINHGNVHEKFYASYTLQKGYIDPIGYLRSHLKDFYTNPKLPEFKVI